MIILVLDFCNNNILILILILCDDAYLELGNAGVFNHDNNK
jgi:hypothetical protein